MAGTFVILLACVVICAKGGSGESHSLQEKIANVFREYQNDIDLFWKDYSLEDIKLKQSKIMQEYISPSAKPCDDYFQYACGNALKYNTFSIEATDSGSRITRYAKLMFNAARSINLLNEQYKDNKDDNSAEGKLKTFYSSCIDENKKDNAETPLVDPNNVIYKYIPEINDNPCFTVVQTHLYPLLGAFFIKNYYNKNNDETIKRVSTDLKKTLLADFNKVEWIESDKKKDGENYLNDLEIESGIKLYSDEIFNEIYADLKITPNDYKTNLLNIQEFNLNRTFKEYDYNEGLAYFYRGKTENKLIYLPIFDLQPPNFHPDFPNALLYGAVGVQILENYIGGLSELDILGKTKTDLTSCLENQIDSYGKRSTFTFGNFAGPRNVYDKLFVEHSSIEKSFNTYEKLLENSNISENEKLPGLDVNAKQLFFLSYAQNRCQWKNDELIKYENTFLANFEKFSEVYSCPAGSKMNPEKKCKLEF